MRLLVCVEFLQRLCWKIPKVSKWKKPRSIQIWAVSFPQTRTICPRAEKQIKSCLHSKIPTWKRSDYSVYKLKEITEGNSLFDASLAENASIFYNYNFKIKWIVFLINCKRCRPVLKLYVCSFICFMDGESWSALGICCSQLKFKGAVF